MTPRETDGTPVVTIAFLGKTPTHVPARQSAIAVCQRPTQAATAQALADFYSAEINAPTCEVTVTMPGGLAAVAPRRRVRTLEDLAAVLPGADLDEDEVEPDEWEAPDYDDGPHRRRQAMAEGMRLS